MKTTKLLLSIIMGILLSFGLNAQVFTYHHSADHSPEQRISKKIKKGIRSGELSKREVKNLKKEYRKIENMKRKAWRDGYIDRRERRRINHAMYDFDLLLNHYLHNRIDRHDRYRSDKHRYDSDWNWDWDNDYHYNNRDFYHQKKRNRH
jgi:hypothetical protein